MGVITYEREYREEFQGHADHCQRQAAIAAVEGE